MGQYVVLHPDKESITSALLRFAEQLSPFGILSEELSNQDILVQTRENHRACYLGNYTEFRINRYSLEKNGLDNMHIVEQFLQINSS